MELQYKTLIKINDPSQNAKDLTGVVLAHDIRTNKVTYRIVANNFVGRVSFTTNRWNCTTIGMYEGNIPL